MRTHSIVTNLNNRGINLSDAYFVGISNPFNGIDVAVNGLLLPTCRVNGRSIDTSWICDIHPDNMDWAPFFSDPEELNYVMSWLFNVIPVSDPMENPGFLIEMDTHNVFTVTNAYSFSRNRFDKLAKFKRKSLIMPAGIEGLPKLSRRDMASFAPYDTSIHIIDHLGTVEQSWNELIDSYDPSKMPLFTMGGLGFVSYNNGGNWAWQGNAPYEITLVNFEEARKAFSNLYRFEVSQLNPKEYIYNDNCN